MWRPGGLPVRTYHGRWWPLSKGVDIMHGLDCFIPDWRGVKLIVTFHDLLVVKSGDDLIASGRFREKKRKLYEASVRRADAVIADSEATKRDLVSILDVPEEKVHVIHLGIEEHFFEEKLVEAERVAGRYGLEPGYFLFVGAVSGRKNTERLVHAYARSKAGKERRLVLAGAVSYQGQRTLDAVESCGLGDSVKILGYVPDEDLPGLYAAAGGFVFPTLYEGFGIPVLEAMASGTPVLTGDRGAAPETAGGLAVTVDPYDVDAIAEGIDRLLEVPESVLAEARKHASTFTWRRCAEQTLEVYEKVLSD